MARLKLATYNINGIRARLPALLEWLERERPDIACLQELKAPDEAFPASDVERLGYGAIWHGQKSWNGVAILARGAQPEERRRGLPGDPDDTHSRYLEASVHGLVVGALYLPNGNPWPGPKFDYKLAWFERLIRHARKLLDGGEPVVLAGDFNVVPTDELDIYDPKSWRKDALLQPESREAWFRLLQQGWTDSLRTAVGDAKVFTFWDYFRKHWERDAGLRIDHLLLSPNLSGMLADAGVDRWVRGRPGASDHAPTWLVLDTDGRAAPRTGRTPKKAATKRASTGRLPGSKTSAAKPKEPAATKSVPRTASPRGAAGKAQGRGAKPARSAAKTASSRRPAKRPPAPR
jgi:exodeoxyribonuclease-3